jgi:hypothetical protein
MPDSAANAAEAGWIQTCVNALDVLEGHVEALRALLLDAQEGLAGCVGGLARCLQLKRLRSK